MSSFQCSYCNCTFGSAYKLKRHISQKHTYSTSEDMGETSQSSQPSYQEETGLWDDKDLPNISTEDPRLWDINYLPNIEKPGNWDEYFSTDDPLYTDDPPTDDPMEEEAESEGRTTETQKLQETDVDDEMNKDDVRLTIPFSADNEDYGGTTVDDAVNDKMHPPKTEWPNNTYREFMEIVTEYQLSNSCGDRFIKLINSLENVNKNLLPKSTKDGRKFLDASDFPYMKFKKVPITKFQGVDYEFHYQPIINGIKTLLLQPDINKEFVFRGNANTNAYGEQFESEWWIRTEKTIPVDNYLLSIIIYADATTCDHLGKTSEHPIYISLGNIPNWLRNKSFAKVLVGYLPKLKAKDATTKNSASFRKLQRLAFQRCLRILLSPLLDKTDMYFVVKNDVHSFTPKISVILADMAEAGAFTATYLPSTTKRPCFYCLISNDDLNNMTLSDVVLRTPEKMREVISTNQAHELSIHNEFNFFWKFKDFNIYQATVPDRMHMLDLGITKYLLEFTRTFLQQKVGNRTVKEMDHRLCAIPRYPGLIILKNGLENVSRFTANDYRNIMKVIIFVVDNLYDNYEEGVISCRRLCRVFYRYLTMYMKLRQESFTDEDLVELQTYITKFCQEFVTIFSDYSSSNCKIPKLHVLHYHLIPSIRLYGSTSGMSTETYETLHKTNVKNPYRASNKKRYIPQMLNTVRRQHLANKQKSLRTRKSSGFRNLLWEFRFAEIGSIALQITGDNDINPFHKEGFDNFDVGLKEFINEYAINFDENFGHFKVYSSASVESTDIIRTSGSFYGNEWFSDVAVSAEEDTMWYRKALLLLEFFVEDSKPPINLVLLRWYDEIDEVYGCPRLQLTEQYTCVYLDSVDISVHIIPRCGCENEYFVNRYIF